MRLAIGGTSRAALGTNVSRQNAIQPRTSGMRAGWVKLPSTTGRRDVAVHFKEGERTAEPAAAATQAAAQAQIKEASGFATTVAGESYPVLFQLTKNCPFGQAWAICGSCPELGSWDPAHSVVMKWTPGDHWYAVAYLPALAHIEYKIVLLDCKDHGGIRVVRWADEVSKLNLAVDVKVGALINKSPCLTAVLPAGGLPRGESESGTTSSPSSPPQDITAGLFPEAVHHDLASVARRPGMAPLHDAVAPAGSTSPEASPRASAVAADPQAYNLGPRAARSHTTTAPLPPDVDKVALPGVELPTVTKVEAGHGTTHQSPTAPYPVKLDYLEGEIQRVTKGFNRGPEQAVDPDVHTHLRTEIPRGESSGREGPSTPPNTPSQASPRSTEASEDLASSQQRPTPEVFNPVDQPVSWVNPAAPEPNQLERTGSGHYKPIPEVEEADRRGRGETDANEGSAEGEDAATTDPTTAAALKQPTSGESDERVGHPVGTASPGYKRFPNLWGVGARHAPGEASADASQQKQARSDGFQGFKNTISGYFHPASSAKGVVSSTDDGSESSGIDMSGAGTMAAIATVLSDMAGADEEVPPAPLDSGVTPVTGADAMSQVNPKRGPVVMAASFMVFGGSAEEEPRQQGGAASVPEDREAPLESGAAAAGTTEPVRTSPTWSEQTGTVTKAPGLGGVRPSLLSSLSAGAMTGSIDQSVTKKDDATTSPESGTERGSAPTQQEQSDPQQQKSQTSSPQQGQRQTGAVNPEPGDEGLADSPESGTRAQ